MLLGTSELRPDLGDPSGVGARPDLHIVDADSLQPIDIPSLRDPYPAEAVNAVDMSPNPGPMGELYITMRQKYPDGMSLACARPRDLTYNEIVQEYVKEKEDQKDNFDPFAFWEKQFETPSPEDGVVDAPEGVELDDYWDGIRPKFIRSKDENGAFDIWMPYDRSVAGAGRFGFQSFLWDGYQMTKGYAADGLWEKVLNVVDNTEYQINLTGHEDNGSAWFLATRAHPPYFSNMVSQLADGPYGEKALVRYLPAMEKEYRDYWMDGREQLESLPDDGKVHEHRSLVRVPLGDGKFAYLNRYWDDAEGPRLESYKEDFDLGVSVLDKEGITDEAERETRLHKLFKDIRAGAASGWDFSSRWLADGKNLESINTTDILPIDLNSLMARTELVLARAHRAAGNFDEANRYLELAQARIDAINLLMWDKEMSLYRDYNYQEDGQTEVISSAMAYPLYVGISNIEQTFGVKDAVEEYLLFDGGIVATNNAESDQQWDGGYRDDEGIVHGHMNVWAPPNWAYVRGLARMAHMMLDAEVQVDVEPLFEGADKAKHAFMNGVQKMFKRHRKVMEKHPGDDPEKEASGGEYEVVKVLAMPGETYRALKEWNPRDPKGCLPIGHVALMNMFSVN
ncbi:MAG: trehalase family glycosidase [Candidatus Saccharimonadales bacterium]